MKEESEADGVAAQRGPLVRADSPALNEAARRCIEERDRRTTPRQGDPCPCGRGAAIVARGGLFGDPRYHCEGCEKDVMDAALRFIMDTSFGGP